jgi:poly-beta-hydroxyalkanoate depolymerase
VEEEAADVRPFGTLVHTARTTAPQPKVCSSHRCRDISPLTGTVRTLLAEHDVYVTDWHNARDIGLAHGRFGFDEYVQHVIDWLELLGTGTHSWPCRRASHAGRHCGDGPGGHAPSAACLMAATIDTRASTPGETAGTLSIDCFSAYHHGRCAILVGSPPRLFRVASFRHDNRALLNRALCNTS